ncbi:MAG: LysM domain-containing protein [Gammaproteobacteria bacterium]
MTIKKLVGLLAITILTANQAIAETVNVPVQAKPDSPQQYVVQPGDSLWKIADLFLQDPWRWPGIWQNNRQIENPHLIYPGDVIALVQTENGVRLVVNPVDNGDLNLSPSIRSESLAESIPLIPRNEIAQFLEQSTVLDNGESSAYPYVLAGVGEHVMTGAGDQIYARQLTDGNDFNIYRIGQAYEDSASNEHLGFAALYVGSGSLVVDGDPAKLLVTRSQREILPGDVLLPHNEALIEPNFKPRPADAGVSANIIDVVDGVSQIGQYNVVVIDRGSADGMEAGHTLRVFQSPPDQYDPNAAEWVALPDERAGTMLVFKSFERVSFGLIMSSTSAIKVNDKALGGAG